jgi:hypothetical protein
MGKVVINESVVSLPAIKVVKKRECTLCIFRTYDHFDLHIEVPEIYNWKSIAEKAVREKLEAKGFDIIKVEISDGDSEYEGEEYGTLSVEYFLPDSKLHIYTCTAESPWSIAEEGYVMSVKVKEGEDPVEEEEEVDNKTFVRNYLEKEWRFSCHKKYHYLFDQWFKGITDDQLLYFEAYARGKKSPYVG